MGHIQNALVAAAKRDFARCLSELDHAKVALIAYKAQVEKDINGGKEERPN
jgi:hypothetical protein